MPEYDLDPLSPHPDHGPVVVGDLPCTGCGYNLTGIPVNGVCPECAKHVALSLRGEILRFASAAYVRAINLGLALILTALLVYVAIVIIRILLGVIAGGLSRTAQELLTQALMLLPSGLMIFGYWKFTTPDPGFTGRERPNSARNVARIAAIVQAGAQLGAVVLILAGVSRAASPIFRIGCFFLGSTLGPSGPPGPLDVLAAVLSFVDVAAWGTLFFAVTLYVRWVAQRVPDQAIVAQTRTFIWLLPVLYVVGYPFCGLGPLIAVILFATMLQALHVRTREAIDWQQRGGGRYLNP